MVVRGVNLILNSFNSIIHLIIYLMQRIFGGNVDLLIQ